VTSTPKQESGGSAKGEERNLIKFSLKGAKWRDGNWRSRTTLAYANVLKPIGEILSKSEKRVDRCLEYAARRQRIGTEVCRGPRPLRKQFGSLPPPVWGIFSQTQYRPGSPNTTRAQRKEGIYAVGGIKRDLPREEDRKLGGDRGDRGT